MTDNWRWIKMCVNDVEYDYTNIYRIYRDGRVESVKRKGVKQRFLKEVTSKTGYKYVNLSKDNEKKKYYIHRLVAIHFISNPRNFPVIDHKNQEKDDNSISNLRWCSHGTNNRNLTTKRPKHNLPRGVNMTPYGKYQTRININYKSKYLGSYETKEEASEVYEEALLEQISLEQISLELDNIHL